MKKIYFNNATASYKKADGVNLAIREYADMLESCAEKRLFSEKRGAIKSIKERLSRIFNYSNQNNAIITSGAASAVRLLVKSTLKAGDHCIVACMENKPIIDFLSRLSVFGVELTVLQCNDAGKTPAQAVKAAIRDNTKLVLSSHASNVSGVLQEVEDISRVCKEKGVLFALDVTQTAGQYDVSFDGLKLSALIFSADKSMLGPDGIGALIVSDEIADTVKIYAGTDSLFCNDDEINTGAAMGLERALAFIENTGVDNIRDRIEQMTVQLLYGIKHIRNIETVGSWNIAQRVGIVLVNFTDRNNAECAEKLKAEYGVVIDYGMQSCSFGNDPVDACNDDAIRFSISYFNTVDDISAALAALEAIANEE